MRIKTLQVHGFGRLKDFAVDLVPGINLIVGENESGKSTLQQALVAAVFGFYNYRTRGARAKEERNAEDRFHPWDSSAPYGCTVEYCLDDGSTYRLDRTFRGARTEFSLRNLSLGEDLTPQLELDRYGAMQPVDEQRYLGMSKEVFLNSACVDQGKLRHLSTPTSLTEAVAKALDSDEADVSAKAAVASLEKAFRTDVGTSRASVTPLATARRELEEVQDRLRQWDEALERVDVSVREEVAQTERLAQLERKRAYQQSERLKQRIHEVTELLGRIAEMDARLTRSEERLESLRDYEGFSAELRDRIIELRLEVSRSSEVAERLTKRQAEEGERALALGQRLSDSQATIEQLDAFRSFPADLEERIRGLISDWRNAFQRLHQIMARPSLAAAGDGADDGWRLSPAVLLAGGAAGLALLVAGALLDQLPLFLGLGLAVWILTFFLARRQTGEEAPDSAQPDEKLAAAAAAEQASRDVLLKAFAQAGITGLATEEAIDRFERALRARWRLQEAEEAAEDCRRRLAELAAHDEELTAAREVLGAQKAELRDLFAQAGVLDTSPDSAWGEYEAGVQRHREFIALQNQVQSTRRERELVLSGSSVESLNREKDDLERRLTEIARGLEQPGAEDPVLNGGDLESTEREIQACRERLAELRREVELGLPDGPSRAELEEQALRLRLEVERLERFGMALQMAQSAIQDAAKQARADFVPQLNERMAQSLHIITAGRYTDVSLELAGDAVGITLRDPQTGTPAEVDALSLGTIDQCYISLRLAIAEILSEGGERLPLLLDDPFVNFDQPRTERMLEFLLSLARERQVLLFTKDRSLEDWLRLNAPAEVGLKVIPMPGPGPSAWPV